MRIRVLLFGQLKDIVGRQEESVDLQTAHLRFDIDLLADRLIGAMDWLDSEKETRGLPVGLFGASTGGGAALMAYQMLNSGRPKA